MVRLQDIKWREGKKGRTGEREKGRMGEWVNGRMGEWENGRMGEWETVIASDVYFYIP
jgi:hypothetical protein